MRGALVVFALAAAGGALAGSASASVTTSAGATACLSGKTLGASCYPACPNFPNWTSHPSYGDTASGNGTGKTADGTGLTATCAFAPTSSICDTVKAACGAGGPLADTLKFTVSFALQSTGKTSVVGCGAPSTISTDQPAVVTIFSYTRVASAQIQVDGPASDDILFTGSNGAASTSVTDLDPDIVANARAWLDQFGLLAKGCATQAIKFSAPLPKNPSKVGTTSKLHATGGGSGNLVTLTSGTPKTCTVTGSAGTVSVKFVAAGVCRVVANQAGGGPYPAATGSYTVTVK
jgi:hypothetical protein